MEYPLGNKEQSLEIQKAEQKLPSKHLLKFKIRAAARSVISTAV